MHFKSTTPEELFNNKLNAEEYGKALQLARAYNLDTDLVYQKQWRSRKMTKATINDNLVSTITKTDQTILLVVSSAGTRFIFSCRAKSKSGLGYCMSALSGCRQILTMSNISLALA